MRITIYRDMLICHRVLMTSKFHTHNFPVFTAKPMEMLNCNIQLSLCMSEGNSLANVKKKTISIETSV